TVWRVLYNRSFEVLLFGTACALLMSPIGLARSWDIAESNHLPLALGFNVFINAFPANPTTWFIGTYLHLLLLWAFLLRTTRITPWVLAGSCVLQILGRAVLIEFAGGYVAYMQLLNWLTVFLMGIAMGRRSPVPRQVHGIVPILAVALVVCWPVALGYVTWKRGSRKDPLGPCLEGAAKKPQKPHRLVGQAHRGDRYRFEAAVTCKPRLAHEG
ncbi:MAG: hypothetical protein ACREXY_22910, partial [Gammaproteobacteria bacterium]